MGMGENGNKEKGRRCSLVASPFYSFSSPVGLLFVCGNEENNWMEWNEEGRRGGRGRGGGVHLTVTDHFYLVDSLSEHLRRRSTKTEGEREEIETISLFHH